MDLSAARGPAVLSTDPAARGGDVSHKTMLAVAWLHQVDAESAVPVLAGFDGASAVDTVVQPGPEPPDGRRRLEMAPRLRAHARQYHPVGAQPRATDRPPHGGPRLAAPHSHLSWSVDWQRSRAWTKEPILRTFQVKRVALPLWRLLLSHLERDWGAGTWWAKPAWNRRTRHAFILDLRRLFWRDRAECSPCMVALAELENTPQPLTLRQDLTGRAV